MNYVNFYSFMLHMIMYINACYTLLVVVVVVVVVVVAAAAAAAAVVVVVAVVVVSSLSLLNLSLGLVVRHDFC